MANINGKEVLFSTEVNFIDGGTIDTSNFATKNDINNLTEKFETHKTAYENAVTLLDKEYYKLKENKQDKLTEGENITISEEGVISANVDVSGKLNKQYAPTGYVQAYVATPDSQTMVDIKLDNQGGLKGNASLVTGNAVALEIEATLGDISSTLTELHDYAQSLKGGEA